MDMFLFSNFQVRAVLVGDRPHPFSNYERLEQFWAANGIKDWSFDTTTTFSMLKSIKDKGHDDFHAELTELLWFGGVLSYGNIMREVYAKIYAWIDPLDFADVDGLCEDDDGVSFRIVVQNSLRIVRVKHIQEMVSRGYDKLDDCNLVMRPRGMTAFFAKLRKAKLELKRQGEVVSEAYLLRITWKAIAGKHEKLDDAVSKLRTQAGVSGIPTKFSHAQTVLTDIFDFEVPASAKNEKPIVPVNLANSGNKRKNQFGNKLHNKKQRRQFAKGSCPNCPDATDHTFKYCFKERRKEMGLPNGWQWCTFHTKGCHYEHLCKRHAPNFPPVPSTIGANAALCPTTENQEIPKHLRDQIAAMIANASMSAKLLPSVSASSSNQQQQNSTDSTKAMSAMTHGKSNFRSAHGIPTNAAQNGPPVTSIFDKILKLSKQDRNLLAIRLSSAEL